MEDFDELDRAIFALPLAVPPSGLREAILRSTIYATQEATLAIAMREIVAIGAAIAIAVWVTAYAIWNPAFAIHASAQFGNSLRSLAETQTLAWLAAGAAIALVANNLQRFHLPRAPRNRA